MKRTVAFEKNARNIFFHVLTNCNLSCRHCYINPAQHGKGMVSLATAKKWMAELSGKTGESNLILLGGEPTLHPDLPEIARAAKEMGYASVTVDTNGFLFHDFLDRVTPSDAEVISFSIDGPTAAKNDLLRGPGSFEACVSGIRRAKERGFSVSVITTVTGDTIDDLALMPPLLAGLGVNRFFIQVIGLRGRGTTAVQARRDRWKAVVPKVAQNAASLGLTVIHPKVYLDSDEPFACAGREAENYFVFPNGRVYRCPLCEDFPLHAYSIRSGRLRKRPGITEDRFFSLDIPEGCVINRLIQPGNTACDEKGGPLFKVACCMLKEETTPD
ncbi:MAG: radical SAM protein [Deltaproteobacteria bacterium]|nr:radical SAM protein [Deltaproteobacteria bacterium]